MGARSVARCTCKHANVSTFVSLQSAPLSLNDVFRYSDHGDQISAGDHSKPLGFYMDTAYAAARARARRALRMPSVFCAQEILGASFLAVAVKFSESGLRNSNILFPSLMDYHVLNLQS